jgi:hypothetical protein
MAATWTRCRAQKHRTTAGTTPSRTCHRDHWHSLLRSSARATPLACTNARYLDRSFALYVRAGAAAHGGLAPTHLEMPFQDAQNMNKGPTTNCKEVWFAGSHTGPYCYAHRLIALLVLMFYPLRCRRWFWYDSAGTRTSVLLIRR